MSIAGSSHRHLERRGGVQPLAPLLLLALLAAEGTGAPPAPAVETLHRVLVSLSDYEVEEARFDRDDWDVFARHPGEGTLELAVSLREIDRLWRMGYRPLVLDVGRPLEQALAAEGLAIPSGYKDLPGILVAMQALAAAHPTLCAYVDLTATLGTPATWQGRHVYALKISDNVTVDEDEPTALFVADHHAREITTPEIALDVASHLLANYGGSTRGYVDRNEIWIVPTANPDGYNQVVVGDNMWRKNLRDTCSGTANDGVDLNRNYPKDWATSCAGSTNGCDYQLYKGPSAGSEPETQTMMALNAREHFAVSIDYHSSGEQILWGYYGSAGCPQVNPSQRPPILDTRNTLMTATGYGQRGPSAGGEHYQWQYQAHGILAYLIEINSSGQGFQPPYSQVAAIAAKVRPALNVILDRVEGPQIRGHVRAAGSLAPLQADVSIHGIHLTGGEVRQSEPRAGRYQWMLMPGLYQVKVSRTGYRSATAVVYVGNGPSELDVLLSP